MYIFLFWLADIIFSTLIKRKIKIENKFNDNFICNCLTFVFDQKLFVIFFSINNFFAQITFSYSL